MPDTNNLYGHIEQNYLHDRNKLLNGSVNNNSMSFHIMHEQFTTLFMVIAVKYTMKMNV